MGVSTEGKIAFYDVVEMRKLDLEISNIKAIKTLKSKSRLLCLTINHIPPIDTEQKKKKNKNKKRNRVTKDEKLILKRQKKQ